MENDDHGISLNQNGIFLPHKRLWFESVHNGCNRMDTSKTKFELQVSLNKLVAPNSNSSNKYRSLEDRTLH